MPENKKPPIVKATGGNTFCIFSGNLGQFHIDCIQTFFAVLCAEFNFVAFANFVDQPTHVNEDFLF